MFSYHSLSFIHFEYQTFKYGFFLYLLTISHVNHLFPSFDCNPLQCKVYTTSVKFTKHCTAQESFTCEVCKTY